MKVQVDEESKWMKLNKPPQPEQPPPTPHPPEQPPPDELLKRADLSPAPIQRRDHLRLKKVKGNMFTKMQNERKVIGVVWEDWCWFCIEVKD